MGKIYNPTTLGLFTRGRQFEQLPENTTNSLIVKVLFPILSKDKENKLKLKNHTVEILSWLSYIITPIMLLLVINAEPIIEFFLTEKWLGASDFLIILAIAGIFIPINNTLLNIFNVIGKPIVSSQVYLFKIVFTATLIFFVWEHGALWTVSIIILDNILVLSILGVITKRFIGLSMKSIFKSIGSVFLINALAFTLVYCFLTYSTFILGNFTHIMVSAIMYCFMIYVLSSILKMNQIKQIDKRIKNLFLKK